MINAVQLNYSLNFRAVLSAVFFLLLLLVSYRGYAEGVFQNKKENRHQLSGVELNRIKAEHQIKFGKTKSPSSQSSNPWKHKKNKQAQAGVSKEIWGECRDYALHKRNRCYREGRDAYHCEQLYDARVKLCNIK
jgi:hypothetical protein